MSPEWQPPVGMQTRNREKQSMQLLEKEWNDHMLMMAMLIVVVAITKHLNICCCNININTTSSFNPWWKEIESVTSFGSLQWRCNPSKKKTVSQNLITLAHKGCWWLRCHVAVSSEKWRLPKCPSCGLQTKSHRRQRKEKRFAIFSQIAKCGSSLLAKINHRLSTRRLGNFFKLSQQTVKWKEKMLTVKCDHHRKSSSTDKWLCLSFVPTWLGNKWEEDYSHTISFSTVHICCCCFSTAN